MNIIETNFIWNGTFTDGENKPDKIVLHHAEAIGCTVQDIDRWHKNNGWAGIGYHYYIRKDGSIYRGRKEGWRGSHCPSANYNSIGICFEGKYDEETSMPDAQFNAGMALISDIRSRYNSNFPLYKHGQLYPTSCPGKNFPFDAFVNGAYNGQPINITPQQTANLSDVYSVPSCNPTHQIVEDDLYVRDSKGIRVEGRQVDKGDKVQLVKIIGDLAEVIYPTPNGFVHGFVKYITSMFSSLTPSTPQQQQASAPVQSQPTVNNSVNAIVENDWFYTRTSDGTVEEGHRVDIGDKIKVIDVGYTSQLALVEYPVSGGTRQAYIKNVVENINYLNSPIKISGTKDVFDRFTGVKIGSVSNENVIVLEDLGDKLNVVYCTDKGNWTKSGKIYK